MSKIPGPECLYPEAAAAAKRSLAEQKDGLPFEVRPTGKEVEVEEGLWEQDILPPKRRITDYE